MGWGWVIDAGRWVGENWDSVVVPLALGAWRLWKRRDDKEALRREAIRDAAKAAYAVIEIAALKAGWTWPEKLQRYSDLVIDLMDERGLGPLRGDEWGLIRQIADELAMVDKLNRLNGQRPAPKIDELELEAVARESLRASLNSLGRSVKSGGKLAPPDDE